MNSTVPSFIKVTKKRPINPWPSRNQKAIVFLKNIGKKYDRQGNSLYLIGSAAGLEEARAVNDLDLVVVVKNFFTIYQAEKLARKNKQLKGIKLPITYVFFPWEWLKNIEKHVAEPTLSPAFFTYVKANYLWLGGKDNFKSLKWPRKDVIKKDAALKVKNAVLSLFKEINKKRFTREQNYLTLKGLRAIIFNAMYFKGYFGFSKTELFELFLKKYQPKNSRPARLMLKTRQLGRDYFLKQNPQKIQEESLLFAQEMWDKV